MTPLIYTSKGNVPIDSLKYETEWNVQPGYITFVERYVDDAGEVVKQSVHAYDRIGVAAFGEVQPIGA